MPTYRDEAVVLRTHLLGEADRIITLLTRTHGKVRAVAKGCDAPQAGSAAGSSRSATWTSSSRRAAAHSR
ncbi:DNA repair protein RecO [Tessaracoccus coleopterorum]|uniref:DNA repair protein RecO n=1 Tax=Tessaracoccus coleopterorum TaxID=2714950 RepID=UPI002F90DDB3